MHAFTGGSDGAWPAGTLGLDKVGNIYGTTAFGGSSSCQNSPHPNGCGTAFELKVSGSTYIYQQIHAYQGGTDGAFPTGPVLVQPDDTVLATTSGSYLDNEGSGSAGTVSELYPSNEGGFFNVTLFTFGDAHNLHLDLSSPLGGVIEDSRHDLFGTAAGGGTGHAGRVFQLSMVNGTYRESVLYSFKVRARYGAYPIAGVIQDAAGNLYGTTPIDHNEYFNGGTVFELSPTQSKKYAFTELNVFSNSTTGYSPAGVTMGYDGALYGTTLQGGAYGAHNGGNGVVFKITL